jgi:hypothetical protein
MLALDPILCGVDKIIIAGLHALAGERAGVLDLLFSHPAPARLLGRIVLVCSPAVEDPAGAELRFELRELLRIWVVGVLGVLFSVEVIEVAVEFIEAVYRWQEPVLITESGSCRPDRSHNPAD